jgi:hypothetical protein
MPGAKCCVGDVFSIKGFPGVTILITKIDVLPGANEFGYHISLFNPPIRVPGFGSMTRIGHLPMSETGLDLSIDRHVDHRAWGQDCPAEGFDIGYHQWQESQRAFFSCPIASVIGMASGSIGAQPSGRG